MHDSEFFVGQCKYLTNSKNKFKLIEEKSFDIKDKVVQNKDVISD